MTEKLGYEPVGDSGSGIAEERPIGALDWIFAVGLLTALLTAFLVVLHYAVGWRP